MYFSPISKGKMWKIYNKSGKFLLQKLYEPWMYFGGKSHEILIIYSTHKANEGKNPHCH